MNTTPKTTPGKVKRELLNTLRIAVDFAAGVTRSSMYTREQNAAFKFLVKAEKRIAELEAELGMEGDAK